MKIFGFFVISIFSLQFFGCASHHKVARNTASIASYSVEAAKDVSDPTMITVVGGNRMPAANGSLSIDLPNDPVSVVASIVQLPGDSVAHATLLFTVKKSPEIAGQISGNTEGSDISKKFVRVVTRMQAEGVNAAAAAAIVAAQNRFKSIASLPADERTEAIKAALFDVRDKLLNAY